MELEFFFFFACVQDKYSLSLCSMWLVCSITKQTMVKRYFIASQKFYSMQITSSIRRYTRR